ncbi:MAG: NADPH:quinone reductase [Pseudomonadota bacterium]
MRAITYDRTGPAAEVLSLRDLPDPAPGPGEVLVRVHASGINPADVKRRAGWGGLAMGHPLVIPHTDGAGVIKAVGDGVDARRIGQRVWMWNAQGGYGEAGRAFGTAAELIALPAAQAVPLPDRLSFAEGACIGVPAMTAHRCVMSDGPVTGLTLLIQGGAGAVGYLACQIAIKEGARLLSTVSGPENATRIEALGGLAIDRRREDVASRVLELTGGIGVDRIIEVDFAANCRTDAQLIKRNGMIASYSSSSDAKPVLDYYAYASKGANMRFIQGFSLPKDALRKAQMWIAQNHIHIPRHATFPLEDCAKAHEMVETPRPDAFGQVVLELTPSD